MYFLIYLGIIFLFKYTVDIFFKKINNSHTLFRSFFCFFISTLSLCFSIYNWSYLLSNSLDPTYLSTIVNKLMLSYMLIDTFYLTKNIKEIRIELIFHHIICIGLYGLFYDKSILAFCALGEILSAYNWIGIIYPQYEWSVKLFRLYSIVFIRSFVWTFTMVFLYQYRYQYNYIFLFGFISVLIFLALDCYWAGVIIVNYLKYKIFIGEKIISHTKKIIALQSKNIKNI
jgi:hypothetical protein